MILASDTSSVPRLVAVLGTVLMVACSGSGEAGSGATGGGESGSGGEGSASARVPDSQLGDLQRENLGLTLPWTRGEISRDPEADAAPTSVRSVRFSRTENVDRMVVEFAADGAYPGYTVGSSISAVARCASTSGDSIPVQGQGLLRVRIRNATAAGEAAGPDLQEPDLSNVTSVHGGCATDEYVEWVLDVQRATYYRTVEASNPPRLVVDVMQEVPQGESAPESGG